MCNTIFLFGPSCSGKSTLGKDLQTHLGSEWRYVDRDELIENRLCTDATADEALEWRIQHIRENIIVDAQIPWRPPRKYEFYFMVFPPLEILLKRDAERTIKLQRSARQAYYAREYVLETYNALNRMNRENFHHIFDSSQESIIGEIDRIKTIIGYKRKNYFKYFCFTLLGIGCSIVCAIWIYPQNASPKVQ
jgi:hypothetical protein